MKLGIILQTKESERVWNAIRLAIAARKARHEVTIFLLGEGVEIEEISDSKQFDVPTKQREFVDIGGRLLACGSCLKSRLKSISTACPVSTMTDLLHIVEESDKVLVFG